jgi:ubiquinone/menaquinone biosynthesis C-methylase UbiE
VVRADAAASLLREARRLAADLPNVSFKEADARSLSFDDAGFDVFVFDSALSHIPAVERALAEVPSRATSQEAGLPRSMATMRP